MQQSLRSPRCCCRATPAAAAAVWPSAKHGQLCPAAAAVIPPARQSRSPLSSWHGTPRWATWRQLSAAGERDAAGGAAPETLQRIQGGEAGENVCAPSKRGTTSAWTQSQDQMLLKPGAALCSRSIRPHDAPHRRAGSRARLLRDVADAPCVSGCRLLPSCSPRPTMLPHLMCSSLGRSLSASICQDRRAWGGSWVPLPRGWAMVPLQWGPHPRNCLRILQVLAVISLICLAVCDRHH